MCGLSDFSVRHTCIRIRNLLVHNREKNLKTREGLFCSKFLVESPNGIFIYILHNQSSLLLNLGVQNRENIQNSDPNKPNESCGVICYGQ